MSKYLIRAWKIKPRQVPKTGGAKQQIQNSILSAAMQEFLEKGYKSASLRNIVKTAGVTTGAFYGYYDSKENKTPSSPQNRGSKTANPTPNTTSRSMESAVDAAAFPIACKKIKHALLIQAITIIHK